LLRLASGARLPLVHWRLRRHVVASGPGIALHDATARTLPAEVMVVVAMRLASRPGRVEARTLSMATALRETASAVEPTTAKAWRLWRTVRPHLRSTAIRLRATESAATRSTPGKTGISARPALVVVMERGLRRLPHRAPAEARVTTKFFVPCESSASTESAMMEGR